jgi:6-phosphogluconolactonase
MRTSVIVCPDHETIAARALDLLLDGLRMAVQQRGQAHLALTGGSTAAALFEQLRHSERSARLDWGRVHVWQGDERFVPLSHPDSNWAVVRREWLERGDGPRVPDEHLHPMPVEAAIREGRDAAWAAARYATDLEALLPRVGGVPAFDVVLLGVGSDGHILSTFPGTAPISEERRSVMSVEAPAHIEPRVARVTLAPHLLRAAGLILVMVPGAAKAGVLTECFGGVQDPDRWPAQLAIRPNAVWLLDVENAPAPEG